MKYIYEKTDREELEKHIEQMKTIPTYFQNSYTEIIRMMAWDEVLMWQSEGKNIVEHIKKLKHDMLSD